LYLITGKVLPKVLIRLPPRKVACAVGSDDVNDDVDRKRKNVTDTESEAEERHRGKKDRYRRRAKKSEDDMPPNPPKKRGRPHKESEDELPVIPERRRGRPRKEKENQPKGFEVSAVVEIAQPPKHVKGKTAKGNKWVKREPLRLGPFSFTERTSWSEFLEEVRRTAYISEEQMVLTAMTWRPNKSTNNSLPLTDLGGYRAMVRQIVASKDPSNTIVIISHPLPKENVPNMEVPVSAMCISKSTVLQLIVRMNVAALGPNRNIS
jgi:hypothetical protein